MNRTSQPSISAGGKVLGHGVPDPRTKQSAENDTSSSDADAIYIPAFESTVRGGLRPIPGGSPASANDEVISVTLRADDLVDSDDEGNAMKVPNPQRRKSWIDKLKLPKSEKTEIVMMTRGDYLRYWARDKGGKYIGTEPEGEGRRLLRKRKQTGSVGVGERKATRAEDRFGMIEGTIAQAVNYGSYLPSGMGWGKENERKRLQEGIDMQRGQRAAP